MPRLVAFPGDWQAGMPVANEILEQHAVARAGVMPPGALSAGIAPAFSHAAGTPRLAGRAHVASPRSKSTHAYAGGFSAAPRRPDRPTSSDRSRASKPARAARRPDPP